MHYNQQILATISGRDGATGNDSSLYVKQRNRENENFQTAKQPQLTSATPGLGEFLINSL